MHEAGGKTVGSTGTSFVFLYAEIPRSRSARAVLPLLLIALTLLARASTHFRATLAAPLSSNNPT